VFLAVGIDHIDPGAFVGDGVIVPVEVTWEPKSFTRHRLPKRLMSPGIPRPTR
jgi:hypothetical protein